jgi:actin-related protein 5
LPLQRALIVVQNALKEEDLEDEAALDAAVKKLETIVRTAKKREAGEADVPEEPSTALLDIPDEEVID